jgi:hypothetical protein
MSTTPRFVFSSPRFAFPLHCGCPRLCESVGALRMKSASSGGAQRGRWTWAACRAYVDRPALPRLGSQLESVNFSLYSSNQGWNAASSQHKTTLCSSSILESVSVPLVERRRWESSGSRTQSTSLITDYPIFSLYSSSSRTHADNLIHFTKHTQPEFLFSLSVLRMILVT